jgi:soluble lytic murein transglycosylase-like protein
MALKSRQKFSQGYAVSIVQLVRGILEKSKSLKTGLIIILIVIGVLMPTKTYFLSDDTINAELEMLDLAIKKASKKYSIEEALIKAIAKHESGLEQYARRYDHKPLSKQKWFTDAMAKNGWEGKYYYYSAGYMQVLYLVCKTDFGFKGSFFDLFDTETNIDLGCQILAKQLKRYGGDVKKAISAYNAGHWTSNNQSNYTDPVYKLYVSLGGTK